MEVDSKFFNDEQKCSNLYTIEAIYGNVCHRFLADVNCAEFQKSLSDNGLEFPDGCNGKLYSSIDDELTAIGKYIKEHLSKSYIRQVEFCASGARNHDKSVSTNIDDIINKINAHADKHEITYIDNFNDERLADYIIERKLVKPVEPVIYQPKEESSANSMSAKSNDNDCAFKMPPYETKKYNDTDRLGNNGIELLWFPSIRSL